MLRNTSHLASLLQLIKSRSFWLWLSFSLSIAFLASYCVFIVLNALSYGIHVNTYAANGTFQLYNPLRRLDAGQVSGVDFPFFHGIGVPLLHYPVFKILGGNLFAAEVAKYFVSPVMLLISTAILCFAFFRDIKKSTIATAIAIFSCTYLIDLAMPGNSLIGIRSTFPVLVAAALLWQRHSLLLLRGRIVVEINEIVAVILLGLSFINGVEQGVAAILSYICVKLAATFTRYKFSAKSLWTSIGVVTSVLAAVFATVTVYTLGRPWEALRYALVDIPSDQSWYFGAPPKYFLGTDAPLPELFTPQLVVAYVSIVCAGCILFALLKQKAVNSSHIIVFAFMLLTGMIALGGSMLGYFSLTSQIIPLLRMSMLVLCLYVVFILFDMKPLKNKKILQNDSPKSYLLPLLTTIFVMCLCIQIYFPIQKLSKLPPAQNVIQTAKKAIQQDDYFASSKAWRKRINTFRPYLNSETSLWSLYTSTYDSYLTHSLNPSRQGADYVIHALGDSGRQAYTNDFSNTKPDFVITLRPSYFIYEEWLWGPHESFYELLLNNYKILTINDSHILWKRATDGDFIRPHFSPTEAHSYGRTAWRLPDNITRDVKVYKIKVDYNASSQLGLRQLDRLPRYLIDVKNSGVMTCPISLPPAHSSYTFLVAISPGKQDVYLHPKAKGLLAASLEIKSITYSELSITPSNLFMFEDNYRSSTKSDTRPICPN